MEMKNDRSRHHHNLLLRSAYIVSLIWILIIPTSGYAQSQTGRISYYHEGTHTASGERFNKHAMTCAHRSMRFGTVVTVNYRGRSVSCRVNDRGPFVGGRILDVSLGTAQALGMTSAGVIVATISW